MTTIALVEVITTDDSYCYTQMLSEDTRTAVYLPDADSPERPHHLTWSNSTGLGWGNLQLLTVRGQIEGSWWIGPEWRTIKIKRLKVKIRAICLTSHV